MDIREGVIKFAEFVRLRIRLNYVPFDKNIGLEKKDTKCFFEVLRNYWLLKKESIL